MENHTAQRARASLALGALITVFPAGAFVGCGGVTAPPPGMNDTELEAEAPVGVSRAGTWAGGFQIDGSPRADACTGEIILAAQNLSISGGTVHADVVDRDYPIINSDDDLLVAEGRFDSDACPASTLFERWTLSRTPTGFSGTLESTWSLPPRCDRACTVTFNIDGTAR